jgi:parallel beta-helix repeat protein
MKNLFYLYFVSALLFVSCDEAVGIEEEVITPPEEVIPTPVPDDKNTPSDFDFTTMQPNDTLNIVYSHDLGGKSIVVPADVVINYNQGKLINGTLVFTQGKIAGELLNHKLKIHGKPSLTSTIFKFEKSEWEITEGEVSDAIALINKNTLENVIAEVKSYGVEVFQIDDLDAYFLISSDQNLINGRKEAISIPSDFSLEMTDNTHLRVQANRYLRYNLLNIMDVSNVKISGGNLYGDRDNHDYTPITVSGITYTAFEWGHLISIEAGVNIKITNVHLSDAVGDGLDIHSLGFAFESDYIPTNNITVSDCVFDGNRRNNLSITDGYNMLIENNTFINAGCDTQYSKGTAPGCGIDVEGYRKRDANGDLVLYQIAKDVIIRNNTEKGSKASAILVAIGQDITIENNTVEKNLGFSLANGVKIRNNTVTGKDIAASITGGSAKKSPTTYGNEISGNTLSSSRQGITVYNKGVKVYDNKISDCVTGISINNITDAEIYNNTIISRKANSYGILSHVASVNNVDIKNNDIDVSYKSIAFVNVNIEAGQLSNTVTVSGNELTGGKVSISNSNGIVVE